MIQKEQADQILAGLVADADRLVAMNPADKRRYLMRARMVAGLVGTTAAKVLAVVAARLDRRGNGMTATHDQCGRAENLGRAIEGGWVPDYYDAGGQPHGPACPECAAANLTVGDDGKYEVISPTVV